MPPDTVYVGRPTKWANPWSVGDGYRASVEPACDPSRNNGRVIGLEDCFVSAFVDSAEQAVALYAGAWLTEDLREQARAQLAGKDLACLCPLDQPCHADVLLEIANGVPDEHRAGLPRPRLPRRRSPPRHLARRIAVSSGDGDPQIHYTGGVPAGPTQKETPMSSAPPDPLAVALAAVFTPQRLDLIAGYLTPRAREARGTHRMDADAALSRLADAVTAARTAGADPGTATSIVLAACGHWWREHAPAGFRPTSPRVCSQCPAGHPAAVGVSPQGLAMVPVTYLPDPGPGRG